MSSYKHIIYDDNLFLWLQCSRETPSRLEINKRGVEELFADILYQDEQLQVSLLD